jgi:hypothetical protein
MAVGLVLILSITGRDAHAQWGYGGWGYGGWGAQSSVGAARQGAGYYAMGAGMYNLDTAQARSINENTATRYNNYVAQVTNESAMMAHAKIHKEAQRDRSLYDAHQKQLRDNPTSRDIETGDALNLAVADLSDPRLGSSALRAAKAPVSASLIAAVPFINAADRVTIMLDDLRASVKWPEVFEEERFANDKKTFDNLVTRMRREAQEGDISAKTLREAKGFVNDLHAKLDAQPLKDPDDQKDAMKFLTACTSLLGLLDKPDIRPALLELRKIQTTMVGNLLGFMHAYNLRFGPATTPKEREVYTQLFGILDQTRDEILAEAKLDSPPTTRADASHATDFFQNLDQGRSRRGATPQPPPPRNPQ